MRLVFKFFKIFSLIFIIPTTFATEVASVAVVNLSSQSFNLICHVGNNTHFYNSPDKTRQFYFGPLMDQSIDIKNLIGDHLSLHCFQQNLPNNFFNYKVRHHDEIAKTHGRFQYDPAYPGAFSFN